MQYALRKEIGLAGVVSLGVGTALGVSIFSVLGPAAAVAGPALLVAILLAAVPMFVVAMTYAFIGSAAPASGASYEWCRAFLNPFVAFLVQWLRIASNVGAMVVLALILAKYLATLVPLPTRPVMAGAFALIAAINLLGTRISAGAQTALMLLLLVLFAMFSVMGLHASHAANFFPFAPHGVTGVLAAIPLLVTLFYGVEAATEVGEEIRESARVIPLGIAFSLAISVVAYLGVAAATIGVLGARMATSDAPILDAAQVFMGRLGAISVALMAIIALTKSLNAVFMVFSRFLFAMARHGAIPVVLSSVHPTRGTPDNAMVAAFLLCCLGLLLPDSLTFLLLALGIPTLIKFATTCLSAMRLVKVRPDLYERAAFRLSRATTIRVAFAGAIGSAAIALAGLAVDWRPYVLLSAWGALGCGWYLYSARGNRALS